MEIQVTSLSIKEMINLKADNEKLTSLVGRLREYCKTASEDAKKNLEAAQSKTSEIARLERKNINLENKCRELENSHMYSLGKCEAYEAVIKQLIGGQ